MATRPTIAVQLYTLRDLTAQDMIGTLRQVKEIGYEGVELAGYGNASPEQVQQAVQELGLQVVGAHTGFDALKDDLAGVVAQNRAMDNTYIVCPSIPRDRRNEEGYRQFGNELEVIGDELREHGMMLCYHNHDFELNDKFNGEMGLDLLYANCKVDVVQAEIDTFWIQKGGENPADYISKMPNRTPLIHVKDMTNDERETFAEVGTGKLDWPAIFAASEANGAVTYIVEQDVCPGNPLDSIRISLENLKQMGKL